MTSGHRPESSRAVLYLPGLLLVALVAYLAFIPLRPEAWGGPRGPGRFEDRPAPAAGWLTRETRLGLERFATIRSPEEPVAATAEALLALHVGLLAARYVLLTWAVRRASGSDWFAILATAAAFGVEAVAGFPTSDANVGLFLFTGLVGMTTRPTLSTRALVALSVGFLLWPNAHASVTIGLAWLGVVAAGRTVEWWWSGVTCRRWWVAFGLCTLASCANPDGPRMLVDGLLAAKNPNLLSLPAWQPIDFSTGAGRPYVYLASLGLLLLIQLGSRSGFTPTTLSILLTFGVWPLVQQRGLAYWWLILPWLAAPYLGPRFAPTPVLIRSLSWAVWIGIALIATPGLWWMATGVPRSMNRIVSDDTPWQVAETLKSGEAQGTILCGEAQGDYLAWRLEGESRLPVAVYSRPETIARDHWDDAYRALSGAPDWWDVLDQLRCNQVVIDRDQFAGLAERLRTFPAWRIVRDDGRLFVAERRQPRQP